MATNVQSSFMFIVGDSLEGLRHSATKVAKSHAARLSWKSDGKTHPDITKKYRRRPACKTIVYEGRASESWKSSISSGSGLSGFEPDLPHPSLDRQFGGGRVDPFRTYPADWQDYFPRLVDHCM